MTDKPITPEEAANYIGELIVHGWDKSAICPEKRAYDIINQQRADARLEAEIEIARLRVALKPFTDDDAIELATFLIEEDSERFPKSHNPQNVHFCDEFGNSGLNAVDFLNAKEALTPSDPSPIMALVRAAVRLCKDDNLSRDTMRHLQAFGLYKAVEALPDWVRSL